MKDFIDVFSLIAEYVLRPSQSLYGYLSAELPGVENLIVVIAAIILVILFLGVGALHFGDSFLQSLEDMGSFIWLFFFALFIVMGVVAPQFFFVFYIFTRIGFFLAIVRLVIYLRLKNRKYLLAIVLSLIISFVLLQVEIVLLVASFFLITWASFEASTWVFSRYDDDLAPALLTFSMVFLCGFLPLEAIIKMLLQSEIINLEVVTSWYFVIGLILDRYLFLIAVFTGAIKLFLDVVQNKGSITA